MSDIVTQVKGVNHLIAEISSAIEEQTRGILQVSDAVGQLDQVAQQNAGLVEESAAAADNLERQAASLARIVGVFKLGGPPHEAPNVAADGRVLEAIRPEVRYPALRTPLRAAI